MAKFCTKCGKPLEKGAICFCQEQTKSKQELSKNAIQDYGKLCLNLTKEIFIRPVDTIKKYSKKENLIFAIMALFINSILFGLLYYCMMKEGNRLVEYDSLFSIVSIEVPFLQTFLKSTLFIIAGFTTSILSIYFLSHSVLKSNADIKSIISMMGICSIFTIIAMAVSIVSVFISMKLTIILLLASELIYCTHIYEGISLVTKVEKNKRAYLFVGMIFITAFVVLYLLPKILF